jgi:carbonic anhydrase
MKKGHILHGFTIAKANRGLNFMYWFLGAFLTWVVATGFSAENSEKEHKIHWSYDGQSGPAHWAELSSKFHLCRDG